MTPTPGGIAEWGQTAERLGLVGLLFVAVVAYSLGWVVSGRQHTADLAFRDKIIEEVKREKGELLAIVRGYSHGFSRVADVSERVVDQVVGQ